MKRSVVASHELTREFGMVLVRASRPIGDWQFKFGPVGQTIRELEKERVGWMQRDNGKLAHKASAVVVQRTSESGIDKHAVPFRQSTVIDAAWKCS
jgi:hypothetical protein